MYIGDRYIPGFSYYVQIQNERTGEWIDKQEFVVDDDRKLEIDKRVEAVELAKTLCEPGLEVRVYRDYASWTRYGSDSFWRTTIWRNGKWCI